MDSRFMMAALSGTRIERNTAISSRKRSTITTPMKNGSRWLKHVGEVVGDRREAADVDLQPGARWWPRG